MYKINIEIMRETLSTLPENRKEVFRKAIERNAILTSWYGMEFGTMTIYKEGFYMEFFGTRSRFAYWCFDNDGEFVHGRKPHESKLHMLYKDDAHFGCDADLDFYKI